MRSPAAGVPPPPAVASVLCVESIPVHTLPQPRALSLKEAAAQWAGPTASLLQARRSRLCRAALAVRAHSRRPGSLWGVAEGHPGAAEVLGLRSGSFCPAARLCVLWQPQAPRSQARLFTSPSAQSLRAWKCRRAAGIQLARCAVGGGSSPPRAYARIQSLLVAPLPGWPQCQASQAPDAPRRALGACSPSAACAAGNSSPGQGVCLPGLRLTCGPGADARLCRLPGLSAPQPGQPCRSPPLSP